MSENISSIGEFGLIKLLERQLPKSKEIIKGIGDDTAVLPLNNHSYLLMTTDMIVEGVHFTLKASPEAIGYKSLACNISDIAAMGGVPSYGVVSIGIPKNFKLAFIQRIYKGIRALASQFNVSIVGGDTVKSSSLVINIALLGEVKKKHLVLRTGAKVNDTIFVSGPLGGSLRNQHHLNFIPRVAQARFLVKNFKPNAMMDISDGLAGDLNHILNASGVGAKLDFEAIPRNINVDIKGALCDGEDFELLFTLNSSKARKLLIWQKKHKLWTFYPIGYITANPKERIKNKSFSHF